MKSKCVLYVEDNLLCSLANSSVIEDGGFEVVEAHCAAEAVEVIDRHDPLDALITDINLGSGEDGFAVSRHARVAYPDIPVIYVSAAAGARVPLEGVERSVFIAKPFHPRRVVEALDRVLHHEEIRERIVLPISNPLDQERPVPALPLLDADLVAGLPA